MCDNCKNLSLEIVCPECKKKIELQNKSDKVESDVGNKRMNLNDAVVDKGNMNLNE